MSGLMSVFNIKSQKAKRKELRNNSTSAEAVLWRGLNGRQLDGKKFRRQHGVGPYIVDFYCPECRLAIELDGQGHFTEFGGLYDLRKDAYLKTHGIRVIHFENKAIFEDIENVLLLICEELKA